MMKWDKELEDMAVYLREGGATYKSIADKLGTTPNSIKHKIRRLGQKDDKDKYKHTREKRNQAELLVESSGRRLEVLETNCGYGGMTEYYSKFSNVTCLDIDGDKISHIQDTIPSAYPLKCDSEKKVIEMLVEKRLFDIIDIDPYGMPSRYFPYAFGLIDNGIMLITLPMIGVAQINKITIRHLSAFWGVDYTQKEAYIDTVFNRLSDYAFMHKREIKLLDCKKIERIYRLAISVEKKSLCDIVGLTVNR